METCEMFEQKNDATCLPEDSRASRFQPRDENSERQIIATSGRQCCAHITNMVLAECLNDLAATIEHLGPAWIVAENVADIGYRAVALDIPACAAGLPTLERHVWIIAEISGDELEGNAPAILPGPAWLTKWDANPRFIEAVKGFPDMWTALAPLEMPSRPTSRIPSSKPSGSK